MKVESSSSEEASFSFSVPSFSRYGRSRLCVVSELDEMSPMTAVDSVFIHSGRFFVARRFSSVPSPLYVFSGDTSGDGWRVLAAFVGVEAAVDVPSASAVVVVALGGGTEEVGVVTVVVVGSDVDVAGGSAGWVTGG